ncbi:STM3941 family protein [Natrarchaeobius chitinivorans]|uniref:Uncharacterized protein n=1 Tax=Natrarchaeobius chitinivorans TaxID=1679083 RepID=A0A3N6MFU1_NATCH|nr:STM3941 family protein [Natrarchaeobius chitinivorans]RQG94461.1 hypothetical protein EA473_12250 [Natrarchaeobius chitinivorans]
MPSPSYFGEVRRYLRDQGWNTSSRRLQEGVFLYGGTRKSADGRQRVVVLAVVDPDVAVTERHLRHLWNVGREKDADAAVVTKAGGLSERVTDVAESNGFTVLESETVRRDGSEPSHERSEYPSDDEGYEIYPSRLRMLLYFAGSVVLALGCGLLLSVGPAIGLYEFVAVALATPLFAAGSVLFFYRLIDYSPVIRIDATGIRYRKFSSMEFIPWDRIESVDVERVEHRGGSTEMLQIAVTEYPEERWWQRLQNGMNKAVLGAEEDAYYVPIDSYGVSSEEVTGAIEQYTDGTIPVLMES